MPSGLYIAASGMNATIQQQNVIANNLANLNTTGFKGSSAVDVAFPTYLYTRLNDQYLKSLNGVQNLIQPIGLMGGGVDTEEVATDFAQGSMLQTKAPLDFAINGKGFFTIQGPNGHLLYTRDGSFNLNSNGELVTKDGYPVLGHAGTIYINSNGHKIVVDSQGDISVDNQPIDQLQISNISNLNRLVKLGHSLYEVPQGDFVNFEPNHVQVEQGYLEQSNVNGIQEMVSMIAAYRSYETNAKVVSMYDEIMGDAATQVGDINA
jgi:flagellar basal-body rod protein FlgG